MQKIKAKIPVFLIVITVIAACVLHLFQFFEQADMPVSFMRGSAVLPYIVYILIFSGAVFAAIYSSSKTALAKTFDFENGKSSVFLSSIALAVTFFYDFIHQGYNCYSYISGVSFVEYAYIIPVGISGAFALVSSFYFITLAMTARNSNYDFRNFTLLHFAPVAWAFSKLVGIMVKIVDVRENAETCCEFILLCVTLYFLFNMISTVDKKESSAAKAFIFSSIMLVFMSLLVSVPRIIMLFLGKIDLIDSVFFSSSTYLMLGAFSFTLLADINNRTNQKN